MKKLVFTLLAATAIGGAGSYPGALADPGGQPAGDRGLPFVVQNLQERVDRNTADIQTNAGRIGDNFSSILGNSARIWALDERVSVLEAGAGAGGARTEVDVDCFEDPDALLNEPINGNFAENPTYNILGPCNGSIVVNRDGVYFTGVDETSAIVLPAGAANPANGAVFGDGAHDLRLRNLLIDASAWANPAGEEQGAAGVYARNAFVRIVRSNVIGGSYGINPYRNAIVRLVGEVNVSGFYNAGIAAGDQSLIIATGQVNVSTPIANGQSLNGVLAYRQGLVDLRGGLTVYLPPADEGSDFAPEAISALDHGQVRVRGDGFVDVNGFIYAGTFSMVTMHEGNYNSAVQTEGGAVIFNGSQQTGAIELFEAGKLISRGGIHNGAIQLRMGSVASLRHGAQHAGTILVVSNSTLDMEDANVGFLVISSTGVANVQGGTINGARLRFGGNLRLSDTQTFADIELGDSLSLLRYSTQGSASLLGNTVYLCGSSFSFVNPPIDITGTVDPGCRL